MDDDNLDSIQTVSIYLEGARNALQGAQYNLAGEFYGIAVNRAYYVFFYCATAMLLTLDITRHKHSAVLAAFRQHFVKTGILPIEDSQSYGEAFQLRNVSDYEMLGKVSASQSVEIVSKAQNFFDRAEKYCKEKGYL